jgi:predicted PurR-regulated permease PerM
MLVAAALVLLIGALASIRDTLMVVFVGIFLGFVFEIPVRFLMRRAGLGRGKAATLLVLGSAAAVTVLALLFVIPLVGGVRDLLKDLPDIVAELQKSNELSWLGDTGAAQDVHAGAEKLANAVPSALDSLVGIAGNAFGWALSLFIVVFLALYLLLDLPNLQRSLASVLEPATAERVLGLWERITRTISRWAIGAAIIAVIAGTVQGTTAWILGSSYALALGVIAGLLDLIPNIGATIAGLILTTVLLAEEGLTAAIVMLVVVIVYQQVENSVLTPTIQGKATNISPFLVILSVTVFGALLGVLGALTAVPIAASIQIIVQELTADRRARMEAMRKQAPALAAERPPS